MKQVSHKAVFSKWISLLIIVLITPGVHADFSFRSVESFQPSTSYKTIQAFEQQITDYEQACLGNYAGSSGGVHCLVAQELWDKELNLYYQKLLTQLDDRKDKQAKAKLIKSQRTWLTMVNQSKDFHNELLNQKYNGYDGSMYLYMQAYETYNTTLAMTKARALLLKKWSEFNWYVDGD